VPATLLLADDSPTIQRIIELTFADEDVRVVVVSDGAAAIARIEEQPPDIVLADVGVPRKNGYEVASYVKHSPRLSHIPVLLLTGAFEPVDQHRADQAGCDGVLAKPFEPQLVIARVKEFLEHSRGTTAAQILAGPAPVPAAGREPTVPRPPAHDEGVLTASESLGDFFDKLDAAFANLPSVRREMPAPESGESRKGAAEPAGGVTGPLGPRAIAPAAIDAGADDIWDLELPSTSDIELPSFLSPGHDTGRVSVPRPATASSPRPATGPLGTVAFATLLDAEQPGAAPANTATWVRPPAPPIVTDELVERVTQRVLERMSERVVRETTAEIVWSIAERLVREEIERLRAAIRNL
jgi:CheY-like chemotaxis protein